MSRIALMGHGLGLVTVARVLEKAGHKISSLLTHPASDHQKDEAVHQRQKESGLYGSIFDLAADSGIPLREEADVNRPECIEWLRSFHPDYLVSLGLRSIVRKVFIEAFPPNRVLNIHATPLPRYRGGASDTWMILNGERDVYGVCHVIDEGIDTGPIVSKKAYSIPDRARPVDVYKNRLAIYGDLLLEALRNLENPSFSPAPQSLDEGFTLPKLNTDVDGRIDWNQKTVQIDRHIRAFGEPYAGAFTDYQGLRLRILDGHEDKTPGAVFHPNAVGTVVRGTSETGWTVVTGDGVYQITKMRFEDGKNSKLRLGARLGNKA